MENYTDLEDFEIDLTSSGIKDIVSGSKELRDEDPKGEIDSKKPKGTPITIPITT